MERRTVLGRAGAAIAAGAVVATAGSGWRSLFRPALAATPEGVPAVSFERKLAEFFAAIRYDDLPSEVIAAVKRVIVDTLGCAFGAVGSEPAGIAERTIRKTFGEAETTTIIGSSGMASVEGAVFVNGVLVRSLDLNDTYLGTEPLHPSEVLPTALGLCEDEAASGRTLIETVVSGYESSARITDALSFIERGFHPLCAMSYAIPLMAGRVWRLPDQAVAHAVGLSAARGYTSFVVNSGEISMMKAMGLAATAVDGILMTRLAAQGFTGPAETLKWFAARLKPSNADISVDLGHARYRLPRVAFKRFPIQIELAAVAEAGSILAPQVAGRAHDIQKVVVQTYPGIIDRVADPAKFRPTSKGTADHSLPVCLAMALLDGDVSVKQFEDGRWRDRAVMSLVERISVEPSERLMAKLPKGRGATVEVVFSDGGSLTETVEVPEGDAQRPLSRASLEHKFSTFATPVVGDEGAQRILAAVDDLENLQDVRHLTRLLRETAKKSPT